MEVDEGSDQKSKIYPHWMAAHAHLKNEFMEDEKCHNLMSWLKYLNCFTEAKSNTCVSGVSLENNRCSSQINMFFLSYMGCMEIMSILVSFDGIFAHFSQ